MKNKTTLAEELRKISRETENAENHKKKQAAIEREKKVNELLIPQINAIIESLPKTLRFAAKRGRRSEEFGLFPGLRKYSYGLSIPFSQLPAMINLADYCNKNGLELEVDTNYYPRHSCAAILLIRW